MDFSSLVSAVAPDGVGTALLGIAALQLALKVIVWGSHKVIDFIADRRGYF